MNVSPTRHRVEFGESFRWVPPPGTVRFYVWAKRAPDVGSPRWVQVAGFDIGANAAIDIHGEVAPFSLGAGGATVSWMGLLSIFDGDDPEVAMVTAQNGAGKVIAIDRYGLPTPNATDASSIAAEERRVLRTLIHQREQYALVVGNLKVGTPDGTTIERMDFATLDRRIAEIRARIVWFDTAAAGNALPRAEYW